MRTFLWGLCLSMAVLFPNSGNAQVYQFRSPSPEVTAAGVGWQLNNLPILVGGIVYYPTRGFRMFDGQVMAQVGLFEGVPVYADATIEPGSVIYVPIGRERMREYERRRDRELAGTTGSRAPSFPVASASAQDLRDGRLGSVGTSGMREGSLSAAAATAVVYESAPSPRAAGIDAAVSATVGTSGRFDRSRPRRTAIESIPRAAASNGVWLEFSGQRWYSAGAAVPFAADRFEAVGTYRGFPVYRDASGDSTYIWVSVVKDGPVAPYARH
jgi:hypothetical protein